MLATLVILLVILIIASVMISSFVDNIPVLIEIMLGAFILIVVVLLVLHVLGIVGDDGKLRRP